MKHSFKRILSLVLTFAMVLSCVPAQVFAEETCEHSYNVTMTGATCTEDGTIAYTCTLCGDSYTEAGTAAEGHDYQETANTAATCAEAGSVSYTCSVCEDVYTDEIPATGEHVYADGVCVCGAADPDAQAPAEESAEEPAEEPSEESADEPAEESSEELAEESAEEPSEESVLDPVELEQPKNDDDGGEITPSGYVAQLGDDGSKYYSLEEAVAAVKELPEDGKLPVIVLQDCTVAETIEITEGINIFGAKENENPIMPTITAAEGVTTIFEIGENGGMLITDVNVVTDNDHAILLTADNARTQLGNTHISGAAGSAICVAEGVSFNAGANDMQVQLYGSTVSGAVALELNGSGSVVVAAGSELEQEDSTSQGTIVVNGDFNDVDVLQSNLVMTGETAFTMNGDSVIKAWYVDSEPKDDPIPCSGIAARFHNEYYGNLENALDAASSFTYEPAEGESVPENMTVNVDILSDVTVSDRINLGNAEYPLVLAVAGDLDLTIAQGGDLEFAKNESSILGNLVIEEGGSVTVDPDVTVDMSGAVLTAPDASITVLPGGDVVGLTSKKPLSVVLNAEGEEQLHSMLEEAKEYGAAEIIVNGDAITLTRFLEVPENVCLCLNADLYVPEGTWMEVMGKVEVNSRLELQPAGEMIYTGAIELGPNGTFHNDGCIYDFVGVSNLVTSGEGEIIFMDPMQQELWSYKAKGDRDYELSEQVRLKGDLVIHVGGFENEDGNYEQRIFRMLEGGQIIVPAGCTLHIAAPIHMMDETARIVVEDGGYLVIDHHELHDGLGTIYLENRDNYDDRVGTRAKLTFAGETEPYLSVYDLGWDNGHFDAINESWNYADTWRRSQPGNGMPAIFYLNEWEDDHWVRTPVALEDLDLSSGLWIEPLNEWDIADGAEHAEYFARLHANEDPNLWDTDQSVAYAKDKAVNAVSVRLELDPGFGFYTEPYADEDTYVYQFAYVPGAENAFYFICSDPNLEMIDVDLSADRNGQPIDANIVKYDKNIWKIALKKDTTQDLYTGFNISLRALVRDIYGGQWDEHRDIYCKPWTQDRGETHDAVFVFNGLQYKYYAEHDSFVIWDENANNGKGGEKVENVYLPEGVSYDYESNTLYLDNVHMETLEIPYYWWWENENGFGESYNLPTTELTIHLSGENSFESDNQTALRLTDHREEPELQVNIIGDGTLFLYNGNGAGDSEPLEHNDSAAQINGVDLVIGENAKVTCKVEGENYWYNSEEVRWEPAGIFGLNGCNNSTLKVTGCAEIHFELPEHRGDYYNEGAFGGEYRGLANFNKITVEEDARLHLDTLHLYDGQQFFQRGGYVFIEDSGELTKDGNGNRRVNYNGLRANNGSLVNISGGELHVNAYDDDSNARGSLIDITNDARLQIFGGTIYLNTNILGPAINVGDARLTHGGGVIHWTEELTADNWDNHGNNTFLFLNEGSMADFTGGSIYLDGGQIWMKSYGQMDEGVYGIKWNGTRLHGYYTKIYVEGNFRMSGGQMNLEKSRIEVQHYGQAVFSGGNLNMENSVLKNSHNMTIGGNAKLYFKLTDAAESDYAIKVTGWHDDENDWDVHGRLDVQDNARITIDIELEHPMIQEVLEENGEEVVREVPVSIQGIFAEGTADGYHQFGGVVTINSNANWQMITSQASLRLNQGEINLNGHTGIEHYGDKFYVEDGMVLNIETTRSGIILMSPDAMINGGSMNIHVNGPSDTFGLYLIGGTPVFFNGGIHSINAESQGEGCVGIGIVTDFAMDEDGNVIDENPKVYINPFSTLSINADLVVHCWGLAQGEPDNFVLDQNTTCTVDPWIWQEAEMMGSYNYHLVDNEGNNITSIRFNAPMISLKDWLKTATLTDGKYFLEQAVLVEEDMELRDADGNNIMLFLQNGGKLTVRNNAQLIIPNDSHLVALSGGFILVEPGSEIENYGILANDGGVVDIKNGANRIGYVHRDGASMNTHFGENLVTIEEEVDGETVTSEEFQLQICETKGIPEKYQQLLGYVATGDGLAQILDVAQNPYAFVGIYLGQDIQEVGNDLEIPENTELTIEANYVCSSNYMLVQGRLILNGVTLDMGDMLQNMGVIEANGAKILINNTFIEGEMARTTLRSEATLEVLGYYGQMGANAVLEAVEGSAVNIKGMMNSQGEIRVGAQWIPEEEKFAYSPATLTVEPVNSEEDPEAGLQINGHLFVAASGSDDADACGKVHVLEGAAMDVYDDGSVNVCGQMVIDGALMQDGFMEVNGELTVAGTLDNADTLNINSEATITGTVNNYAYVNVGGKATISGSLNNYNEVNILGEVTLENGAVLTNGRDCEEEETPWWGTISLFNDEEHQQGAKLTALDGATVYNNGTISSDSYGGSINLPASTYNHGGVMNLYGEEISAEVVLTYFGNGTIAQCNDDLKQYAYLIYEGDNSDLAVGMAEAADAYAAGILRVNGKMVVRADQQLQTEFIIVMENSELVINGRATAWDRLNVRETGALTIGADGAVYVAGEMNAFAFYDEENDEEYVSTVNNRGTLECGETASIQINGAYDDFGVGTLMNDAAFDPDTGDFFFGSIGGSAWNIGPEFQTLSVFVNGEDAEVKLQTGVNVVGDGGYRDGIVWLASPAEITGYKQYIPDNVILRIVSDGYVTAEDGGISNDGEVWVDVPRLALEVVGDMSYYAGSGTYHGFCGVNGEDSSWTDVRWIVRNGVLTIYGDGDMADYSDENPAPWRDLGIHQIKLGTAVTSIGDNAFQSCVDASVVIPKELKNFGENCFNGNMYLKLYHDSAAEAKYWEGEEHNKEHIIFIHELDENGECFCGEYSLADRLREHLENETPREAVDELHNIDIEQLRDAMKSDEIANLMDEVETMLLMHKRTYEDDVLNVFVRLDAEDDFLWDVFPTYEGDIIDGAEIIGAAMNVPDASGDISLIVSDPENADISDVKFNEFDEENSVLFSMGLDGVADDSSLNVPVKITLPIPQWIVEASTDPENLSDVVVKHYSDFTPNGVEVEADTYYRFDSAYVSFVTSGFSNYLIGLKAEPVTVKTKINQSVVNVKSDDELEDALDKIQISVTALDANNKRVSGMNLDYIILDENGKEVELAYALQNKGKYTIQPTYDELRYYVTEVAAKLEVKEPDYVCTNLLTGVSYEDLATALEEADDEKSGVVAKETIQMLKDYTDSSITVTAGTTLDLNGHVVTASYASAFEGAEIIDKTRKGLLKVPMNNVFMGKSNRMIPIWNAKDGYTFTHIQLIDSGSSVGLTKDETAVTATLKYVTIFRDSGLVLDGASDNNLTVEIVANWAPKNEDDGNPFQYFVYGDKQVGTVVAAQGQAAYKLLVKDYKNFAGLTLTAKVVSGTGVEFSGRVFNVN